MDTLTAEATEASKNQRPKNHTSLKERISKKFLARFDARSSIGAPFERVPENLHRTANQLALGLELIEDFRENRYRRIPWGSLALLTGALLYAVSPADVLPDALLGLGSLDDAVVLALAVRLIRPQLEAYCQFKGYSWEDYFGSPVNKLTKSDESVEIALETSGVLA
jgi:uncharacterized membrane protein YkvA (DUF1232 family)